MTTTKSATKKKLVREVKKLRTNASQEVRARSGCRCCRCCRCW